MKPKMKPNGRRRIMGIITVMLVIGTVEVAKANLVDSNSIIQDDIEYYIQTDKFVYNLGENVEMLFRVTNLGEQDVTFHFNDQMQYYFTVKQNENLIWYAPKVGLPAGSGFVLHPGEYKEYAEVWDMLDDQGIIVTLGIYDITGSLNPMFLAPQDKDRYVPVSVQIEIIPEPASLLFLGTGLIGLLARNRKKNIM